MGPLGGALIKQHVSRASPICFVLWFVTSVVTCLTYMAGAGEK